MRRAVCISLRHFKIITRTAVRPLIRDRRDAPKRPTPTLGNCIDTVTVVQHKLVHQFKGGKMTPVLYYLPHSPPCRAILLLAKMLDIEFELKVLNVLEGDQMKPDFLQLNPQHCIPTMDDEGLVLWESRAILAYLVASYAKDDSLYPKDIRVRAMVDQRLQFDLGTLYARTFDYFFPTMLMSAPLDETKKAKVREALDWLDSMLKGRQFAAADHFTIADISLLVTVSQIEAFGFELYPQQRVKQWLQRCKEFMEPYDYEEINASKAATMGEMFRAKLQKS